VKGWTIVSESRRVLYKCLSRGRSLRGETGKR
jgi:hypothetical protein